MKCDKKGLLLYAVTDRSWLNGETLYSQVEKALQGGATFIQLREKNLDQDHFMEEALELKKLCATYHVPFVINDNVEIAAKMDADGVHVGQSDMEAGDVRAKLGPDKIIGVSAQTVEQAILAEQRGADYLGVGAVFHTCLLYTSCKLHVLLHGQTLGLDSSCKIVNHVLYLRIDHSFRNLHCCVLYCFIYDSVLFFCLSLLFFFLGQVVFDFFFVLIQSIELGKDVYKRQLPAYRCP